MLQNSFSAYIIKETYEEIYMKLTNIFQYYNEIYNIFIKTNYRDGTKINYMIL